MTGRPLLMCSAETAELRASLCGNCGHVEWTVATALAFCAAHARA
jgi:hypothetical protein